LGEFAQTRVYAAWAKVSSEDQEETNGGRTRFRGAPYFAEISGFATLRPQSRGGSGGELPASTRCS